MTPQHTFFPVRREDALHLCVAKKVSTKTAVTSVHHHSIEGVEEGLCSWVRHVGTKIQELRICHNLRRNHDGSEMFLGHHMKQPLACHGLGGRKVFPDKAALPELLFPWEVSSPWEGTGKTQHEQPVLELWGISCSCCVHTWLIFLLLWSSALPRHTVRTLGA